MSRYQILDSRFDVSEAPGAAWFFERMARMQPMLPAVADLPVVRIRAHAVSHAELLDGVTQWQHWGHFHRSMNYAHWNLEGPAEPGSIFLPGQGISMRYSAADAVLDVHAEKARATREAELTYHAARNLALWRRAGRLAPMLHASAVVFDGRAWLFIGGKGAGKSTLFIESVLRQGADPLANDRVLLDMEAPGQVWAWPSYLSYCEGTIVDYPELRRVFDTAARGMPGLERSGLYRNSYAQSHKRIVPPFFFPEVLGRRYVGGARLGGVVRAHVQPGVAGGARVTAQRRTSSLHAADLSDAVFGASDPDIPCWHGQRGQAASSAADPTAQALSWLARADVPFVELTLDPLVGKSGLRKLLVQ